jgi:hypothetical protein
MVVLLTQARPPAPREIKLRICRNIENTRERPNADTDPSKHRQSSRRATDTRTPVQ